MNKIHKIFSKAENDLKTIIQSFKKSDYDKTIDLIDVNRAFLIEFKKRLKEIDTLPYYKRFGSFGEKQKDINICLNEIIETKNVLEMLYKKLADICTFEINNLKK